jgi:hypothetical protein
MPGYRAAPCPCSRHDCPDWHLEPVATTHGVRFTQRQAELVAAFLNALPDDIAGDDNGGRS